MKQVQPMAAILFSAGILLASCNKKDNGYNNPTPPPPTVQSTVVNASGDLTNALTQFRALIGDSLNTTPGKTSGRREINWDGVPANLTNTNNFPADFFNNTDAAGPAGRKRGLLYSFTGAAIRVDSSSFVDIDASYAAQFKAFSPKRAFINTSSTISDINFKVAGSNTDAFVKGFGIIFSDVDQAGSTTIEYFHGNTSLGVFKAPVRTDANGFSFLGVYFPTEVVTSVRITAGNGVLTTGVKDISDGGSKDLVVMDDVFYDEPKAGN